MDSPHRLRYPDFLCIGAQKAGTTWLHRSLRCHPDIWLPPFKEIQYFNRVHPRKGSARISQSSPHDMQRLENLLRTIQSTLAGTLPAEQKLARVYCLSLIATAERTDEWYGRIFQNAPESALCGEVSPDYAVLPGKGIRHILELNPDTKFIFIMRDPIERGWSHLRMDESRGVAKRVPHLQRIFASGFLLYSDYMTTIDRYRRHVPDHNFLMLFFDDLVSRPEYLLQEVCSFLGVDHSRATFAKAERAINVGIRKEMDDETYRTFVKAFAPIYDGLLRLEHPVARQWYNKHYGDRIPQR